MTYKSHYNITGTYGTDAITVTKSGGYGLGVRKYAKSIRFAFETGEDMLKLCLYMAPGEKPVCVITLDSYYKTGDVFTFEVTGIKTDIVLYAYEAGGKFCADTYATALYPYEQDGIKIYYGLLKRTGFDWEDDRSPGYLPKELIIYKLHPAGFTKNRFSKVKNKGTFCGIARKIPYLTELGINAVELMPSYEIIDETGRNFWGYSEGFYFSPRRDYCTQSQSLKDYTVEFKKMVKDLHRAGIEVYVEMFFKPGTKPLLISDCIRYWKEEYHIDGVHLICDERARYVLANDAFINDLKLFYVNWYEDCENHNLYEYNDGFLENTRRLIKGDEEQLQSFLYHMKRNPKHGATVNYVANNNGFTLADVYSYDRKHNEENGENNHDGMDYNMSWNCGVEGPTRKKKVNELRGLLMRNAMTFLMCAQGIPLIYAGDEFGNSQQGNNNAYCQDNDTGWVDWSCLTKNKKFFTYVKELIAFRKSHGVLHMEKEPYLMDYKYLGMPDMSYHGVKAWYPDMEHYSRQAGILWCGQYAGEESDVYMAFNMHWESHELALPVIKGKTWKPVFSTDMQKTELLPDARTITVQQRTIQVLVNEKNS